MSPDLYERDPFSVLTSAASVIFAIGAELTRSKDLSQIFLAFALILAKFLLKNLVDCGGFSAVPKQFGMAVNYRLPKSNSQAAELPSYPHAD